MKYRYLGSSGMLVSRISLGTMTFGAGEWGCDADESRNIIRDYLEAGGNLLDTADVYSGFRSEEIIGSVMPDLRREEVIVATKTYFPTGQYPNAHGFSRKHAMDALTASLRRMKTDYVDLFYIHGPDPVTPLETVMRTMDDMVRSGMVRYVACSNMFAWQIAKAQGAADARNLEGFVAGQYLYNLVDRSAEREIIPAMVDADMGLVCYSPLGGGLLTGKYQDVVRSYREQQGKGEARKAENQGGRKASEDAKPPEGSRLSFRMKVDGPRFWHPRGFETAQALEQVSKDSGIPMAKLAVSWPLGRRFVTSVIIGVKSRKQLAENLETADWDMPGDVWNRLEEATRPEEEYLEFFNRASYSRFRELGEGAEEKTRLF